MLAAARGARATGRDQCRTMVGGPRPLETARTLSSVALLPPPVSAPLSTATQLVLEYTKTRNILCCARLRSHVT